MSKIIDQDELIRLYTQPGNGHTDQELANRFGVGREAIYKRRKRLRTEYPFIKTERGRWRIDRERLVSNIKVNRYEALILYLATRRLSRSTGLAKRHAQNALEKLATSLYQPMIERLVKAAADIQDRPEAERRETILEELVQGWTEQIKVHIRYQGLKSDRPTNHTISPYLIEPSPWSDSVYVIGKTNVWEGITSFQLERIQKATRSTESFEIDPTFAEEILFKYTWGIWYSDKPPRPIRLRFSGREAIRRLQESVWHPEQKIAAQEDGSIIWQAPIAEWQEMLPWIRGWGSNVEVLEPAELREELVKEATRLTRIYRADTLAPMPLYLLPYAKTDRASGQTVHRLLYHLIDVGQVALIMWEETLTDSIRRRLAQMLNLTVEQAGRFIAFLAALHDLGKAGPAYQQKYAPSWLEKELVEAGLGLKGIGKAYDARKTPHGLVSTWALNELLPEMIGLEDAFAREIATALGGHHGSWPSPGATDRIDDSHYELWAEARRDLVWEVRSVFQPPPAVQAPTDQSELNTFLTILSGLASVADWIGSRNKESFGFEEQAMQTRCYAARSLAKARGALSDLGWIGWQPTGHTISFAEAFAYLDFKGPHNLQARVIEAAQNLKPPTLLILEAPTGVGKTETAVYLADRWLQQQAGRGLYVAMPTQATSNQMYGRIGDFLNHRYSDMPVNYHLVHGQAAWSDRLKETVQLQRVGDDKATGVLAESWFTPRKRTLLAPFGVGTVDQTLMSILQTRHFFVRLFGLGHKVIIFDEVHAYDAFMNALFERLLEWLQAVGASVILLSATLPGETRRRLAAKYTQKSLPETTAAYPALTIASPDGEPQIIPLPRSEEVSLQLGWEEVDREPAAIRDYLQTKLAQGGCAAVICNTVRHAQDIYGLLDEARQKGWLDIPAEDLILFHARFPPVWRQEIEQKVLEKFGKKGRRPRKAIVVATQVIEQSLDLDFDLMLTDLAPIDLIIQRAGRLHRHRRAERWGHGRHLIITRPGKNEADIPLFERHQFVYEPYILLRTYLALADRQAITLPDDTTALIESVYGDSPDETDLSPAWQEALGEARRTMDKNRHQATSKATRQLVLAPNNPRLLKQQTANLEEDDPEVHETFRAQTRDIDPGVSLVCLHREGETTFIYTPDGAKVPINLAEEVSIQQIRQLQQNMMTVQHKGLVRHFVERQPPTGWQQQAALRHCRPVVFEQGVYTAEDTRYLLRLSQKFGLEIIKKEDV